MSEDSALAMTPEQQEKLYRRFLEDPMLRYINERIVSLHQTVIPKKIVMNLSQRKGGSIEYIYPDNFVEQVNLLETEKVNYIKTHYPEIIRKDTP